MKCPGCGSEVGGGIGVRCSRCGWISPSVRITPMEVVVSVPTGLHRVETPGRPRISRAVRLLYVSGVLAWGFPIGLYLYYHANRMPGASVGWRALGMVLALLLAALLHVLAWAAAFFYGRLVTSDQIASEAERTERFSVG